MYLDPLSVPEPTSAALGVFALLSLGLSRARCKCHVNAMS